MPNRDDSNFFSEEEYNENFDDDDDDEISDENPHHNQNFLNKSEVLYTMELDHLDNRLFKETNIAVLREAISIAGNSLFWWLRTTRSKTQKILSIYYDLIDHVNLDKNDLD